MITLFTTSWTIKCPSEPNYLHIGEFFEDMIQEFFELNIDKHDDYKDVWVFSITYPAYQAQEFAFRIMKFCEDNQNKLLLIN